MAAKTSWHRYGTKLRHCHPVYSLQKTAKAAYTTSRKTVTGIAFQVSGLDMSRVAVVLSRRTNMTADNTHVDTILPHSLHVYNGAGRRNNYVVLS